MKEFLLLLTFIIMVARTQDIVPNITIMKNLSSLLIIGGLNPNSTSQETEQPLLIQTIIQKIKNGKSYDAIIDLGGRQNEDQISYYQLIRPLADQIPYFILDRNASILTDLLHLNYSLNTMNSLTTNQTALLFIDTNVLSDPNTQGKVINEEKEQIKLTNRNFNSQIAWKIAFTNQPLFCSSLDSQCQAVASTLRLTYQQLLKDYGFQLIVSGGYGVYERTYPKLNQNHFEIEDPTWFEDPTFPIYVNEVGLNRFEQNEMWMVQREPWVAFQQQKTGFGEMEIYNDSMLQFNQYNIYGKKIDEFQIVFNEDTNKETGYILYSIITGIFSFVTLLLYIVIIRNMSQRAQQLKSIIELGQIKNNEENSDENDGSEEDTNDNQPEEEVKRNNSSGVEFEFQRPNPDFYNRISEIEMTNLTQSE